MKNILLIIFLFQLTLLFGQGGHPHSGMSREDMPNDGIIKGTVIDEQTNKPVKFANAALFSTRDSSVVAGVVCREDGYFELTDLKYGRYYLVVDFIGYYKKIISDLKVYPKNKVTDLEKIILSQFSENIEGVEIVGERNFVEYKIDRKVLNISKNINASGGTLVEALENAPSIQVDIDGNVTMRGSSSFEVLIDGKPSILDANDILKQIPASSVENIEIITNPSVKFDPDGTTGIINIIMKKEHKSGFSGIVNASAGTGNKYSSDFLFNYRTKKVNYYVGANYGDFTFSGTGNSLRETYINDSVNFLNTESERSHRREFYSVKGGIDLYLNDKNTVSFSGRYGFFGFGMNLDTKNHEYTSPETSDIYTLNKGTFDIGGGFYSGNLDYTHKFNTSGHELSASVQYTGRNGGIDSHTLETNTNNDFSKLLGSSEFRTFQNRSRKVLRLKLDYSYPISKKMKFETGFQTRLRDAEGDYKYEDYVSENWVENHTYSNELIFIRNIHSLYTSLSGELFSLQYMLGLRGEYTDRLIDQITSGETYPLQRFDFFPSLHLTKELSKTQQIQASYSKRVKRPRHWYMNPFPGYSDSYSVRVGNPALLPEYIDSYEISFNKRIKKSFINVAAYYRQTNNKINRIQKLTDDGRILNTFDNLDKEYAYGSEISGNIQFFTWWTMYANANIYNYQLEGETAGLTTDLESTNFDLRLNTTFMFSKNSRLQIDGMYNAPTVSVQGTREGFYFIGAAYKQEFLKRKLSLVLRVRDIFKSAKYVYYSEGSGFSSHDERLREAQVVTLSLSYKINNYKQKRGSRGGMEEMNEGM